MKSLAVFPSSREVRLIDTPEPVIAGPTEVELRILEAGVCGTDREITSFQYGTPPADSPHLVIGHEALGEVVGVGSGVTGLVPGDLAVLMVRRPCPHDGCTPCRRGRPDFCITGDFTERGIEGAHGYMTEFVVDDQRYMVRCRRRFARWRSCWNRSRSPKRPRSRFAPWRLGCPANSRTIRATSAQSFWERGPSGCWAR